MYTVYALYNNKHQKIYIGQTKDLKERLRLHKERAFKKSYTARFDGVWELIYHKEVSTRSEALTKERRLKSHQGRDFLKQYIPR